MNKRFWIIIVCAQLLISAALLLSGSFLLQGCGKAGHGRDGLRLSVNRGSVKVKITDSNRWETVSTGEKITLGTIIKTEEGGSATVTLEDKPLVRMAPSTEIEVQDLDLKSGQDRDGQDRIKIHLKSGDTLSTIKRSQTKYYVITPIAVMGVVGTGFRVTVDENTAATRVAEFDGKVSVEKDGETAMLEAQQALDIKEGKPLGEPYAVPVIKETFDGEPVLNLLKEITVERSHTYEALEVKTGKGGGE